jgi:hypothetical protein
MRRYQLDDLAQYGGVAVVWSGGFFVFHTLPSGSINPPGRTTF